MPLVEEETLLAVPLSLIKFVASCLRGAGQPSPPSMPASGPEGVRAAVTLKVMSGGSQRHRGPSGPTALTLPQREHGLQSHRLSKFN